MQRPKLFELMVAPGPVPPQDEDCTKRFEESLADWTMPALAMSVRGTTLERDLRQCIVPFDASRMSFPPTVPADVQERVRAIVQANADRDRPLLSDALLFHGPASELTVSAPFLEFELDEVLRAELSRRSEVMTGRPLAREWGRGFPSTPVAYGGRDR